MNLLIIGCRLDHRLAAHIIAALHAPVSALCVTPPREEAAPKLSDLVGSFVAASLRDFATLENVAVARVFTDFALPLRASITPAARALQGGHVRKERDYG